MKNLLFIILAVCSIQQEKRITLRFKNQYNELLPIYGYWNDYNKIPSKQENISLMRTIQGVSPQIVVTKRYVQIHIILGENLLTTTFEPSGGNGTIDIVIPTGKSDSKVNASSKAKDLKGTQKQPIQ